MFDNLPGFHVKSNYHGEEHRSLKDSMQDSSHNKDVTSHIKELPNLLLLTVATAFGSLSCETNNEDDCGKVLSIFLLLL